MGFINKVSAAPIVHQCVVPPRTGFGRGTTWACDECGDMWKVKTCIGEYETYLEWCRIINDGKKVGFLFLHRFPTKRQPEPTEHDLKREKRIRAVISELGLPTNVLDVVSLGNPSSHAPYHGYQHLLTVALNCKEAADYHGLDRESVRPLVLAALFHDFGHLLQSTVQDALNIEKAVEGAMKHLPGIEGLSDREIESVISLIRATEYPYTGTDTTLPARIIQDADMMQTLEPDGKRFLDGLSSERRRRITVEQNESFLDSIPGNTEWGRKKLHPLRAGVVSD